jgi:long-chain fatty acid transport protein
MPTSDIPPSLTAQGIPTTGYSADIYFKGSSAYLGYQFNIGYKINDMISVAVGARLVSTKNKYNGYIKNISINPTYPAFGAYNGGMVPATTFFTDGQTYLTAVSSQLSGTASSLQPIIAGGGGSVPLANGTAAGLTALQVATIQGTITALGGNPAGMTIAQSQAFFYGASATYGQKAGAMGENATATQNINVNATESGTGITPIISANISPCANLNIAVKYEFKTEINLKTKVANNEGGGIFIDGKELVGDMPAMLSLGVDYKPVEKLLLSASFNTYFDKAVDYDGDPTVNINEIDKNFLEYGLGVEYGLTEKLRISAGWSHTTTGVNLNYQSDMSFSTNTNSIGAGLGYRITPMIDLNLGYQRAFYDQGSKTYDHMLGGVLPVSTTEKYNKSTWMVAAGLDFYFGKK